MDRQGGRWGRRAGHSAGQPPCFDAGRKIGEGGAEATPLAATPGAELDAAQVAEQDATQGAEQDRLLPDFPGAIRWKVVSVVGPRSGTLQKVWVRAYTDSEKKWRHKEILEKRKWTGEWDFDRQTEEAKKARVTPPEPLEPDTDSSGPCFDAGPSNGGGNVMPTKSESEGRGGCRRVVGAPGYD